MKNILTILIFLMFGSHVSTITCPSTPIVSQTFTCSSSAASRTIDSTSLTIPPNLKAITVTFRAKVTSACSVPAPLHLLTATITVGGVEKRIMDFRWLTIAKQFNVFTESPSGTNPIYSTNAWNPGSDYVGTFIAAGASLKFPVAISNAAVVLTPNLIGAGWYTDYGTWNLDSTFKIYACSDVGGASGFACEIHDLKVHYDYFSSPQTLMGVIIASYSTEVGRYAFNEDSGYVAANSFGSMGPGYFGQSTSTTNDTNPVTSPSWFSPGPGIDFSATTQYLTLPGFTVQPVTDFANSFSIGFTAWFKFPSLPASSYDLFRFATPDLSSTRLLVTLGSDGKTTVTAGTNPITTVNNPIVAEVWKQFTLRLECFTYLCYIGINHGTGLAATSYPNIGGVPSYASTDIIRLGGFVGQVASIRIFSPMAGFVNAAGTGTLCDPNCLFDLGSNSPYICLVPKCGSGTYALYSTCASCPANCDVCTSSSVCDTCSPGFIPQSGQCVSNCPTGCATCTTPSICQTCQPGFALQGSQCNACTSGYYAPSPTSPACTEACPSGCTTCTSSSSCQTCSTAFYLQGGLCHTCPTGYYALSSTETSCTGNCSPGCVSCTSSSTCQACLSGFSLQSGQCTACPSGYYAPLPTSSSCSQPCPPGCTTCKSASSCQTCTPQFSLQGSQCVACPSGKYSLSSTAPTCDGACKPGCETCSDTIPCLTCPVRFSLQNSECVECPLGQYASSPVASSCSDCPKSCTACTSYNVCQQCVDGFVLEGSTCLDPKSSESSGAPVGAFIAIGCVVPCSIATIALYLRKKLKKRARIAPIPISTTDSKEVSPLKGLVMATIRSDQYP